MEYLYTPRYYYISPLCFTAQRKLEGHGPVLRISRDRGDRVSPLHLGERNCASTGPKVIKDLAVSTPHPWHLGHFEGTDRSFAL